MMNLKTKKPLIALLVGALTLSLTLTACSANTDSASTPSSDKTQSSSEVTDETESKKAPILGSFTTQDVDGNEVTQSVLSDYTITVVNVWGTFCSPCIKEMPDLGKIAEDYQDKGVQVIGIVGDAQAFDGSISQKTVTDAKDIIQQTGASYLHLLPSDSLLPLLSASAYIPYTIFVDQNGEQIGAAYEGARSKEDWSAAIDSALEGLRK